MHSIVYAGNSFCAPWMVRESQFFRDSAQNTLYKGTLSLDCSKSVGFCIYRMTFEIYLILILIMSFKRYSSMIITSKRRGQILAVATVNKILMKSLYSPSKKISLKITRDKRKNSVTIYQSHIVSKSIIYNLLNDCHYKEFEISKVHQI